MSSDLEIVRLLEEEIELREGLPHLYGQKFYQWQRDFLNCRNKLALITAANQIGKSTVLVKNNIEWATNTSLWPELWKTKPRVFLYLYPSFDVATREFETKWVPEFMPRGRFETHPQYGWKAEYDKKDIKLIRWNSGVSTYFLAYAQAAKMLQATTAHAVQCDEELPEELFSELRFRLAATDGYMRMGFTATLGQEFFRLIMEERGRHELFPQAFKRQISLYDCMYYEDGTPSHWTKERIKELIQSCPNENEVKRRVFGKFVKTEGLRYPSFSRVKNLKPSPGPVPNDWLKYSGVDIGSGGEKAHPGAITFIAVRPDFKKGRIYKHWNGKGQNTTASDIFQKWLAMRGKNRCVGQTYDYSSKDFKLISERAGETFQQAKKEREFGDNVLNSLFKNEMLDIDDIEENYPLVKELENLSHQDRKTLVADDSCFVAGTQIACESGYKKIENITTKDMVLTRFGYFPVSDCFVKMDFVSSYYFSNKTKLIATKNHPVFSSKNIFVPISKLNNEDKIITEELWLNLYPLFLTILFLDGIQKQNRYHINFILGPVATILKGAFNTYTRKYGRALTDQYQLGMKSIIKMEINLTTILKIWNAFRNSNTKDFTQNKTQCFIKKSKCIVFVSFVMFCLKRICLMAAKNFVQKIVKPNGEEETILFVNLTKEHIKKEAVYNLKVSGPAEYFANGILVHNCDATRYAATQIPWDWEFLNSELKPKTPEELHFSDIDDRRKEAMRSEPKDQFNMNPDQEIEFWQDFMDA